MKCNKEVLQKLMMFISNSDSSSFLENIKVPKKVMKKIKRKSSVISSSPRSMLKRGRQKGKARAKPKKPPKRRRSTKKTPKIAKGKPQKPKIADEKLTVNPDENAVYKQVLNKETGQYEFVQIKSENKSNMKDDYSSGSGDEKQGRKTDAGVIRDARIVDYEPKGRVPSVARVPIASPFKTPVQILKKEDIKKEKKTVNVQFSDSPIAHRLRPRDNENLRKTIVVKKSRDNARKTVIQTTIHTPLPTDTNEDLNNTKNLTKTPSRFRGTSKREFFEEEDLSSSDEQTFGRRLTRSMTRKADTDNNEDENQTDENEDEDKSDENNENENEDEDKSDENNEDENESNETVDNE